MYAYIYILFIYGIYAFIGYNHVIVFVKLGKFSLQTFTLTYLFLVLIFFTVLVSASFFLSEMIT